MHSTPHYHTSNTTTLHLPTFTLNFLLLHTLPNSFTSQHDFSSESANGAVSSANNSWFISNLPPSVLSSPSPFPSTLTFTSQTAPSIYTLNNHLDITQPCLNPTLTVVCPPGHTPYYLHKNSAVLSTIFLKLHTLLASATYHTDLSIGISICSY